MSDDLLQWIIRVAGIGHFAVAAASLGVPHFLEWRKELAQLKPINRQIFITYGGYILTINVLFGVLALFGPGLLIDRTPLAAIVCGFIFAYWLARVILQFTYYDVSSAPQGLKFKLAEYGFVSLFSSFVLVFGYTAARNLEWLP